MQVLPSYLASTRPYLSDASTAQLFSLYQTIRLRCRYCPVSFHLWSYPGLTATILPSLAFHQLHWTDYKNVKTMLQDLSPTHTNLSSYTPSEHTTEGLKKVKSQPLYKMHHTDEWIMFLQMSWATVIWTVEICTTLHCNFIYITVAHSTQDQYLFHVESTTRAQNISSSSLVLVSSAKQSKNNLLELRLSIKMHNSRNKAWKSYGMLPKLLGFSPKLILLLLTTSRWLEWTSRHWIERMRMKMTA